MTSIGQILKKKGVRLILLSLVLIGSGCEEQIDPAKAPSNEGKQVEVSLNIGLANEVDGYALSTKSAAPSTEKGAFSYELLPAVTTKDGTSVKPNKLYNLEIVQYDLNGNYKKRYYVGNNSEITIGSTINLTLDQSDDCQLVIVAWGKDNTTTLGQNVNLDKAQNASIPAETIESINPTVQDDMNKMPYVLHLKHVKVTNNKIQSIDGQDARILLKRLAARLTLTWKYEVSNYALKQILLQSIPLNYNVVPKPDGNDTYPSLLDQFTTIQLTDAEIATGNYSRWIPANVRGTNPASNSPTYRIKANAPNGSIYTNFIAGNINEPKKKFDYRIYLGGSDYSDFNIFSNTDYTYNVTIKHTDLPTNDRRVTIIDPIPASENNENFVPTANCFMVAPGGAFCFNPYKFYQNGTTINNTTLQGSDWCNVSGQTINNPIVSVKVLWQTKENGDVGDPVLGTVTSSTDHTNIVNTASCGDLEKARIYCRVAPNTTGGSGVIAAYDANNNILWSWHIWVTDYAPDAKADGSVDDPNKRIQKYTYGNNSNTYPMMDRNLGALAGYTDTPDGDLAKSKANGFHYQCGRKDPFPSTYSSLSITGNSLVVNTDKPTPGMLNYYQPDGVSYFVRNSSTDEVVLRVVFQNPTTIYSKNEAWYKDLQSNLWDGQSKTVHDPCPAGWRVASKSNYRSLFNSASYTESDSHSAMNIVNTNLSTDGGSVIYFESEGTSGRKTYIRLTGYQDYANSFIKINRLSNLWCRESASYSDTGLNYRNRAAYALSIAVNDNGVADKCTIWKWRPRDSHPLRCVQDR
ncbi:DUF4906 domain-containing protein [Parabacteroides sp.]